MVALKKKQLPCWMGVSTRLGMEMGSVKHLDLMQNLSPGTWKTLREDGDAWSCEFV